VRGDSPTVFVALDELNRTHGSTLHVRVAKTIRVLDTAHPRYRVDIRDANLEAVMLVEFTVSIHYFAISEQLVRVSGGLDSTTPG
jgi:hypothetical protein